MKPRATGIALAAVVLGIIAGACSGDATPPAMPAVTATANAQPYAGWETRPIAALAPEQVDDLLGGRGAGFALAAELNHYPGPTHVLELAGELALSSEQERAIRETLTAMQREAQALGRELVELEATLDEEFRSKAVTPSRLGELTAAVAEVEGRLRNVHLAAHLEVTATLTAEQVSRYDALRGYAGDGSEHDAPAGHDSH
ncbi:MAG: hypothetical protein R3C39_11120 [Dehalococcoidia bacterium]